MTIRSYEKNGKTLYHVYAAGRSKQDPKIRVQRHKFNVESLALARREENRLHLVVGQKILQLEGKCKNWEDVIYFWKAEADKGNAGSYSKVSIMDYFSAMKIWTRPWLNIIAADLTKAHGRDFVRRMANNGISISYIKKVKNIVNRIYDFGIEEGLILGVKHSPVHGLSLGPKTEKVPDILTADEIKKLLYEAKVQNNPWYPIWAMALLTGMRAGELHALEWSDVDFENNLIRVSKSFCKRLKVTKSTKAGYWRNVPISPDLRLLLLSLKVKSVTNKVLPGNADWTRLDQCRALKKFLESIRLPKIKFHALRACFATQLLSRGTPAAVVMKICGWRDLKTMDIYLRVAGVEERGATDCLKILPDETDTEGKVVGIFQK
jgi:integrase